jgi:hypothetical protein
MSQIFLFNLISLNVRVIYIYKLLKESSSMPCDVSEAKELEP